MALQRLFSGAFADAITPLILFTSVATWVFVATSVIFDQVAALAAICTLGTVHFDTSFTAPFGQCNAEAGPDEYDCDGGCDYIFHRNITHLFFLDFMTRPQHTFLTRLHSMNLCLRTKGRSQEKTVAGLPGGSTARKVTGWP